jgi:hypothetical protein
MVSKYWDFGKWYVNFNEGGKWLTFTFGWRKWGEHLSTLMFYVYFYPGIRLHTVLRFTSLMTTVEVAMSLLKRVEKDLEYGGATLPETEKDIARRLLKDEIHNNIAALKTLE